MRKWIGRALSALLTLCVLYSLTAPALAVDSTVVRIRTAADLVQLSRSCAMDSWSVGKTVLLMDDIDLTGVDFAPIPTFGGTFDGQDHTISGLDIRTGGAGYGLFRTLQSTALVRDLHAAGTVHSQGAGNGLGGLVGNNYGQLLRCTFDGAVEGENNVGGLVGVNHPSGRILRCQFKGSVTALHYAGGIAGQNLGSIVSCTNYGAIVTTEVKGTLELDSVELGDLTSMENTPVCTDVGGVAGFSSGIIQSCVNHGAVGYPHVGYNIGGIVGRQSGYVDGCVNHGVIQGRKDVGGIAGQMEPLLTVDFTKSELQDIRVEVNTLLDMIDQALAHAQDMNDAGQEQSGAVYDSLYEVESAATRLINLLTAWVDGNLEQVNDLSARVTWALGELEDALEDGQKALAELGTAMGQLADALEKLEAAGVLGDRALEELQGAMDSLSDAMEISAAALSRVAAAVQKLSQSTGDQKAMEEAIAELTAAAGDLSGAVVKLSQGMDQLGSALESLEGSGEQVTGALGDLTDMANTLEKAIYWLERATAELEGMAEELSAKPPIQFETLGVGITSQLAQLSAAVTGLMGAAEALTQELSGQTGLLLDDLRAVNAQLETVLELVYQSADQDQEADDYFEDISDQEQAGDTDTGVISNSSNLGAVAGDVNVAGIVGSLAVEYDFDPEDDLNLSGEQSMDFRYQAKAVVERCANHAAVTAKKDGAGGIVGSMDLGRVSLCESYGPVTSTGGSYVGGIAGTSSAVIRDCWVKCTLSGGDFVGGVAGLADTVTGCRTLIDLAEGQWSVGAIAGGRQEEGELESNLFVHHELAGVDGVSYAGQAEPVDMAGLRALEDMPQGFDSFALTFRADGTTVAEVTFAYGDSLTELPQVPAKAGHTGKWPELDWTFLTFSRVVEAEYIPYSTALTDQSGSAQVLVSGSFGSDVKVTTESETVQWTRNGQEKSGTAWTVTLSGAERERGYTVHCKLADPSKGHELWVRTDKGWQQKDFTTDGSYLMWQAEEDSVTFCVLEVRDSLSWLAIAAAAAAVVVLAGVFLLRGRKGKD